MITESPIVYGLLIFIWLRDTWEIYILFRQWNLAHKSVTVPDILDGVYHHENFSKARLYNMDTLIRRMVHTLVWNLTYTIVLLFEVLILLWTLSNNAIEILGFASSELRASVVLVMIVLLLLATIVSLMKVSTFLLEKRYSISVETLDDYLLRLGTLTLLHLLVICAYLVGVYLIFTLILADLLEIHDELAICPTVSLFSLAYVIIYIEFIVPADIILTMGHFRPIPNGHLKQRIHDLVNDVGFPRKRTYICRTSEISIRSNAFIFNQKIFLSDTLITEVFTDDEVVAVIAHELGHWKGGHGYLRNILYFLMFFAIRIVVFCVADDGLFSAAFNLPESRPLILRVIFVWFFIFIPLDYLCNLVMIFLARRFEIQADDFATSLNLGDYLYSALIKLHANNLKFPVNDWLYETFVLDHPGLLSRLRNLS